MKVTVIMMMTGGMVTVRMMMTGGMGMGMVTMMMMGGMVTVTRRMMERSLVKGPQ